MPLTEEESEAFDSQANRVLSELDSSYALPIPPEEKGNMVRAVIMGEDATTVTLKILRRHRFRVSSGEVNETFYRRDDTVDLIDDLLSS